MRTRTTCKSIDLSCAAIAGVGYSPALTAQKSGRINLALMRPVDPSNFSWRSREV